ncbi:MAG: CinA family protein [Bacillota bacterium]|jgi:PncC family amidohydrolase
MKADTQKLVEKLIAANLFLATAESCTGGGIAAEITSIAGSSKCFGYGIVSYSNKAKEQILTVPASTLSRFGAVSEQTAAAMAQGLLSLSQADIAIAVTGIAGPEGGSEEKPVGLVYIALAAAETLWVRRHVFSGTRADVRRQTVDEALALVMEYVDKNEISEKKGDSNAK